MYDEYIKRKVEEIKAPFTVKKSNTVLLAHNPIDFPYCLSEDLEATQLAGGATLLCAYLVTVYSEGL